jgi:hypothetical protein
MGVRLSYRSNIPAAWILSIRSFKRPQVQPTVTNKQGIEQGIRGALAFAILQSMSGASAFAVYFLYWKRREENACAHFPARV